jgi:hypothetical protein
MSNEDFRLKRRRLLKGLGSLPLMFSPLIYAMRAEAQTGTPKRLLLVTIQHGMGGRNMATGSERAFTLSNWLQPFEAIKNDCIFVDGLLGAAWGNAHDVSYSHLFTSSVLPNSPAFSRPRSASLDVIVDSALGGATLPVLRLGGNGYLCFESNGNSLPFQTNSMSAIESVISNIATGESAQAFNPSKYYRRSILDDAIQDINSLKSRVGSAERNKLDSHLEAIANASRLMGLNSNSTNPAVCERPNTNLINGSSDYETQLDRNFAAIRAAFSCQLGNVAVLNIGEIPGDQYQWVDPSNNVRRGIPCSGSDFHQCVAHYNESRERRLAFEGSVRWFAQKFVDFANSLKTKIEANGRSVLDNTIIVLTGEVGDGTHEVLNKPVIIIGGGGTPGLATGRYLRIPTYNDTFVRTPEGDVTFYGGRHEISTRCEADLWREIAQAMGSNLTSFGSAFWNKGPLGIRG